MSSRVVDQGQAELRRGGSIFSLEAILLLGRKRGKWCRMCAGVGAEIVDGKEINLSDRIHNGVEMMPLDRGLRRIHAAVSSLQGRSSQSPMLWKRCIISIFFVEV